MILNEFTSRDATKLTKLQKALAENYDYNIKLQGMTKNRASALADKAMTKMAESRDVQQRVKFKMIAECLDLWMQANVQSELTDMVAEGIDDDSMEEAKVILAAKELSDKIQGMIEDAAKMQVQDLLPIADAMKNELGAGEAAAFSSQADAALGGLVEALKQAKDEYDSAISAAQGQAPATDMDMDMDGDMGDDMGDVEGMDVDMSAMDDEFGGDAADVGDEPTGREMKDEI